LTTKLAEAARSLTKLVMQVYQSIAKINVIKNTKIQESSPPSKKIKQIK
jgi:hypothetical protein